MQIRSPREASFFAAARPIPDAPPVMTATAPGARAACFMSAGYARSSTGDRDFDCLLLDRVAYQRELKRRRALTGVVPIEEVDGDRDPFRLLLGRYRHLVRAGGWRIEKRFHERV